MSDKLKKILAVVFLTLLIWAWAFWSEEDEKTFSGSLQVSPATNPALLVSFIVDGKDWGQEVPLGLVFKGVPTEIRKLDDSLAKNVSPDNPRQERLNYQYNPADYGFTETKRYPFNLLEFLQDKSKTKELALTLESYTVNERPVGQTEVNVEVLLKKQLSVVCLKENGTEIPGAITDPTRVEMYVRKGYNIGKAYVTLSVQEIELAQQQHLVSVKPYVEMRAGLERYAQQEVEVKITKETLQADILQPFQKPRGVGYIMSDNLLGKYMVKMDSGSESALRTINFRATDEAAEAYKKLRHPILIEIRDEDAFDLTTEIPPKEIIYNFPPEYVAKGEIELGDPRPPKTAIIKLIPVTIAPGNQ